jgi:ectoine hydroxylase-related dioxygenase (phytanoyl-CoA dioxygenase family)
MPIRHFPADAEPEAIAAALSADGAAIVDGLVASVVMDRARGELEPFMNATPTGSDTFSGKNTRRTGALIARSQTCRELVMNPTVLGTVKTVLSHATNVQLHLTQIIAIGPDAEAQQIHRDQWAFDFFPFPSGYEVQCNTIWAMTDFTEENGATRVVAGSHKAADRLEYSHADGEPAEMTKGSVLLYTGSVYHGGGANLSREVRCGVNITYNVAWLRQEENQYLAVPKEIAATLPEDLLRMMGYATGAYALGYYRDLEDPITAVRPDLRKQSLGDYDQAAAKVREERD